MQLRSFGCSFIYGSDLEDCPHGVGSKHPPASRMTWPALLADRYDLDYQCCARPAAGNLQILETLLSNLDHHQDIVVVINWTWIERFSFVRDSAKTGLHSWNPYGWCSILPSDQDPASEIYYKHYHSQFRDKFESLVCIHTAINMLLAAQIKFIMTYTDDLIFDKQWHISPAVSTLQHSVQPYMNEFQGSSYWRWIKQNDFQTSDRWHPLEDAHRAAADLMAPVIDAILHRA
jgi:hypothetical protein